MSLVHESCLGQSNHNHRPYSYSKVKHKEEEDTTIKISMNGLLEEKEGLRWSGSPPDIYTVKIHLMFYFWKGLSYMVPWSPGIKRRQIRYLSPKSPTTVVGTRV